jgi:hypothetical protein
MSKLETNTIDNISGSSTLNIGDTNATSVTIDSGVSTFTIPNGVATGHMYPAFHVYLSSTQEPSNDTSTLVQFDTELLDTDSAYDTGTYRFTPQVAGKYFVYAVINHNPSSSNNLQQASVGIRKNGSDISRNFFASSTNPADELVVTTQMIVDLNGSTDYVDAVGLQAVSSGTNRFTGDSTLSRTYFGAYRIGA